MRKLRSVIIVEDEYYIRQSLKKLIEWEAFGYCIEGEADDGDIAIELIGKIQPFLVMLDITLPRISGMEVLDQLNFVSPKSHVIILSAHDNFEYAKRAIHYGVFEYILKPIEPDVISVALNRLLSEKGFAENEVMLPQIAEDENLLCNTSKQILVVEKIKKYIQDNFRNSDLTLSEIAEYGIMNQNYLCKIFKQIEACSIFDYLIECRLSAAKELLLNNKGIQTKEVADLIGYNDALYFSKVFKKKYKISPIQYRNSENN